MSILPFQNVSNLENGGHELSHIPRGRLVIRGFRGFFLALVDFFRVLSDTDMAGYPANNFCRKTDIRLNS